MDEDRRTCPSVSRRSMLRGAGLLGLALVPFSTVLATASPTRRLRFSHTHTGETLCVDYYGDGAYRPQELASVDHLLRDFRSGLSHPMDPQLLDLLFVLQQSTGHDGTYEVISGYRSPGTNAFLRQHSTGVAEHSMHLDGRAIDVRLTGVPTARLHGLALGLRRGGVGYYARTDFVHLDTGTVRSWVG